MDIRITADDQASIRRLGIEPQMALLLRVFRDMPAYPWRECWVTATAGMALCHFRRWDDLRGEYRRVAVGLLTLKDPFISADTLATKLLQWADGHRAQSLAYSPMLPALARPEMLVHHDTAVPA